jgi:hypothetical protein
MFARNTTKSHGAGGANVIISRKGTIIEMTMPHGNHHKAGNCNYCAFWIKVRNETGNPQHKKHHCVGLAVSTAKTLIF